MTLRVDLKVWWSLHLVCFLVSTYVVCERLSVMHKQVSVQLTSNSKFLSKFSRKPLSGISDKRAPPLQNGKLQNWDDQSLLQNTPPPPKMKNFRFEMTKVYSRIPPSPQNEKLQIWDDQSLLRNTQPPPPPHQWKTSDLRWPKFTPKYPTPPPPHQWKTSDLRWPKFKVYSRIPPSPVGLESGRSYVETNL